MSNLKLKASVTDYESAAAFLGDKASKMLGHNTQITSDCDGIIRVFYYATPIVTYSPGWTQLHHGGYMTATTKHRMNLLTPSKLSIFQRTPSPSRFGPRQPEWFLKLNSVAMPFKDGGATFGKVIGSRSRYYLHRSVVSVVRMGEAK